MVYRNMGLQKVWESKKNKVMKKIMFNDRYGLMQAVIDGRKTFTRRVVNGYPLLPQTVESACLFDNGHVHIIANGGEILMDYKIGYNVGDVVSVAQSYRSIADNHPNVDKFLLRLSEEYRCEPENVSNLPGWTNKMFTKAEFMSHRIRITNIRCERLQDISDIECLKEGVQYIEEIGRYYFEKPDKEGFYFETPREAFASLIDKISGIGTWGLNPFIVVYEFEVVK